MNVEKRVITLPLLKYTKDMMPLDLEIKKPQKSKYSLIG